MSKSLPFTYFGSKCRSFDFINSRLPRTRQYVEPFGGAGTILLNRDPVPVETYNDLLDDIPHFFRVLRDRPDELLESLRKTPYSRSEYESAIEQQAAGYPDCSDIERARLFFTVIQQSISSRQYGSDMSWSCAYSGLSGRGTDTTTATLKNKTDDVLPEIAGRLRDVQIESDDAIEVIKRNDRDTALFYLDPPYLPDTRHNSNNYKYELSEDRHRELASVLHSCDGYVAISGYPSDLYSELYADWNCYSDRQKNAGAWDESRQEVLWTNYDADKLGGEKIGDWPEPTRKGKQLTLTGAIG